jgi:glycosyltransferase involved in cell wall biosynthesis
MIEIFAQISFGLALIAALLSLFNLLTLKAASPETDTVINKKIAILIPFRNEINNVNQSLDCALSQRNLQQFKVFALDDFSTDETGKEIAARADVHKVSAQKLPNDWLGKLWACWQLAEAAEKDFAPDYLVFLDADVRLKVNAVSSAIATAPNWDFISPYPKQLTKGFIPFIFQPLLQWSWLSSVPLWLAHKFKIKSMIVANGQFFIVKKSAYFAVGGHSSIKNKVLDDLQLARQLSQNGFVGGVIEGSRISSCLMYDNSKALFNGYRKSLWAAFGSIAGSFIAFLILALTGVINFFALETHSSFKNAAVLIIISRIFSAVKTNSDLRSVVFHPIAVIVLLYLLTSSWTGKFRGTLTWRDRAII